MNMFICNPTVSKIIFCHICVQLSDSRHSGTKCLFKVVLLGRDKVTIQFQNHSAKNHKINDYVER